ncbi:hypothetical protein QBC35DRAFT_542145 [Podospora australis]|uniref:Uncharacterized protein n=1 Tax=Podospora australis TaxID=1536484 RepID=A0AAN7AE36_9PEZI|nr:hypothetical protein QBC35DRAFT_542145 [Podospora australis]
MSHEQPKDGPVDNKTGVEQLETEFSDMKARLEAFEVKSKAEIEGDRNLMLSELRRTVGSVEGTALHVNNTDSNDGILVTSQASVHRHIQDMDAAFSKLHDTASTGLERIQHIKKTFDDMDAGLSSLRVKLSSLRSQSETALASVGQDLDTNRADIAQTKAQLESTRSERQTLQSKIGHRKSARNGLRVVRAMTWTTSLIFLPAAATGGGLEYVARSVISPSNTYFLPPAPVSNHTMAMTNRKMRHKLKSLQEEIDTTDVRLSSLHSKVEMAEARVTSLEQVLTSTRSLQARVDALEASSAEIKTLVDDRLREYQALKEATDEFGAWTRAVADQTAPMRLLKPDSRAGLRRTIGQIVRRLLERKEEGDVKAICERLGQLELTLAQRSL